MLDAVAHGLSNAEIGEQLFMSHATAKTHVSRLLTKLGARDRAQLVMLAYESGVVDAGRVALTASRRARRRLAPPSSNTVPGNTRRRHGSSRSTANVSDVGLVPRGIDCRVVADRRRARS